MLPTTLVVQHDDYFSSTATKGVGNTYFPEVLCTSITNSSSSETKPCCIVHISEIGHFTTEIDAE